LTSPPRNDLTKRHLNSRGDFGEDLGCEMKISLSSRKVLMAQIGCQKREFGFEILTVSIPTA
jgi:hypothetical protein